MGCLHRAPRYNLFFMRKCLIVAGICALLAGCSSSSNPETKGAAAKLPEATAPSNNPAAKYLELVGFRIKEKGPGKLEITFGVVNHSAADLGDLVLTVNLRTTVAKPGEPPVLSFIVKVPSLGPNEMKEVTASVPAKLRAYDLPDWQFLKADFQITEPK